MCAVGMSIMALLNRVAPDWVGSRARPVPSYLFVDFGYSFLAAAAGGYVTAWVGVANPLVHVLALGIVALALAALNAMQSKGLQPIWYALAQLVILPLGVLAGGLLRLRVLGIL
jgi:hypothetical protein